MTSNESRAVLGPPAVPVNEENEALLALDGKKGTSYDSETFSGLMFA
jgi:hypothetical protein